MRSQHCALLAALMPTSASPASVSGLAVCKVLSLLFVMAAAPAQATVMTFGFGAPIESNGYTEAGLTIAAITSVVPTQIRNWQVSETEPGEREVLDNDGASYIFSLVSGGRFDLLSIDVEFPCCSLSSFGTVNVVGSNGSTVPVFAQSFGTHSFGTAFLGISSFTMQYELPAQMTFDNINFQVVPEPSSFLLLGLSFAGPIGLRRRANR